ncbi:hypothetical protein SCOCK_150050 [Actinacidiphila cocklensis]|uniref:Uncharacterized protein n=1 Tax=Actinacidiphila cocklensis TaxID=887465 RepID=A0A9W4DQB8_9ACTN|nr:hypothetical protein SCOCK_150050 [Actinacidiphila cocklensis]
MRLSGVPGRGGSMGRAVPPRGRAGEPHPVVRGSAGTLRSGPGGAAPCGPSGRPDRRRCMAEGGPAVRREGEERPGVGGIAGARRSGQVLALADGQGSGSRFSRSSHGLCVMRRWQVSRGLDEAGPDLGNWTGERQTQLISTAGGQGVAGSNPVVPTVFLQFRGRSLGPPVCPEGPGIC